MDSLLGKQTHVRFINDSDIEGYGGLKSLTKMNNNISESRCWNQTSLYPDDGAVYCNMTWDSLSCWPTTLGGTYATVSCPDGLQGIDPTKNATKYCHPNGTWTSKANYNSCLIPSPKIHFDDFIGQELESDYASRVIYNLGFIVSTIALAIALFIFVNFRSLRCIRNMIHSHLIVTFILRNIVWLSMQHSLITIVNEGHIWACQLLVTIFNYAQVTNFFWMLVEGLYLHIIIVWTYTADNIRKWKFIIIGWVLPVLIIIMWAIFREQYEAKHSNPHTAILLECWLPSNSESRADLLDYIYIAPILTVLAINMVFLATIIWMLVTKLRASNSLETRHLRKTVKATILLLPLLGITYVIFICPPSNEPAVVQAHKFVNAFLQSFQGFFVALFYCFLNGEVKSVIKKKISRFRDSRFLGSRYSRSSFGWTNDAIIRKESVALANGRLAVGCTVSGCTEKTTMLQQYENTKGEIVL